MTAQPGRTPVKLAASDVRAHHIAAGDTVKLAVLAGPATGSASTVAFEVWEPGGAQPPNSHADSAETFVVLAGAGLAYSDDQAVPIATGDTLTLLPGSVHRIVNTSSTDRLYTLTIMHTDGGFAELIESGPAAELDATDMAVLGTDRRPT